MQHKKLLIFATLLLVLPILTTAQSVGCCINPGAGALACSTERLSFLSECCPAPENANPSYYDVSSSGPQNYNNCTSNFFFPGQSCDSVSQCQQGCCCSATSGEVKTQVQCSGTGLTFYAGETNCTGVCNVAECNDGIDNNGNGCADFPADSGCASLTDTAETGGTCLAVSGVNCNSVSYVPKITNMNAMPVKGQKKISLSWQNECASNLVSNNIYRCAGTNCAGFSLIGTSTENIFIDEDESLKFDAAYTYKIESIFGVQTAKPTATASAFLGNLECWNRLDNNNFCIHESYYNQYKDYLITNLAGFSTQNFLQNVKSTFSGKLNRAFFCTGANVLNVQGTACNSNQICVISNNNPVCVGNSTCAPDATNLFGMFFTRSSCENNKYCFYDRSISTVNSCFACNPGMSCYDYKSGGSCERNNCNAGNCVWRPIADELGTGVCIDQNADNCQWCDSTGTQGLESSEATSVVFEQCTSDKADKLSTTTNLCYYDGQKALNCNDVICTNLLPADCSNSNLRHDQFNNIINNVANKCNLKICQSFSGVCKKNADTDNNADCNTNECEQDVFAPNTTIVPIIDRGLYKSLSIQILDKVSGKGRSTIRTTNDYKTYLCKEPCGSTGHPYQNFTNSYNLVISNLRLFDTLTGRKLLDLGQGTNTIRYYSQDPAKNIGKVKTVQIIAQANSSGPVVFRLNITNGKVVNNVYYTNSKNPVIKVEFFENAIVTSAQLLLKGTSIAIIPDFTNQLSKTVTFTFPRQINTGEYTFELNAKNDRGIFMSSVFRADIVVDDTLPSLVSISPAQGSVITSSTVPITLTFNKKVNIDRITINGENITDEFSSNDNIVHTATIELNDGNKQIVITAKDFAGNNAIFASSFVVNRNPPDIRLTSPPFGISPAYTFDLVVETDNDATCRHSLDSNLEFNFMDQFDSSGGTEHKVASFNDIPSGDRSVHKLYVICNDPLQGQKISIFDLSVDTERPRINNAFAFPNPIVEIPRATTLKVEADKESICKYSTNSNDFGLMEGKFRGFDNNSFSRVNMQEITVQQDGSYSYLVACKSKSGLISETRQIAFSSDVTLLIGITSHTPAYSNTTSITLAIETNKISQCKYSSTDPSVSEGTLMGLPSYSHTKELVLAPGSYTYYVICRDQFLQEWSEPLTIEFTIDATPPVMVFVDDTSTLPENPDFTWRTDQLRAKWLGNDNETRVSSYDYALEEFGTLNTVINWTTSFTENEWVWITKRGSSLNLSPGSKYFFRVKAKNIVGLSSGVMESDGISIDPSLRSTNCSNNIKDPQETDVDCGGACNLCAEGKMCNETTDCSSGFCNEDNECAIPTCNDNVKNQDESNVDCGGNNCDKCEDSTECNVDSDCSSGSCSFGVCSEPEACSDGALTGTETDVDCGGACPTKCQLGNSCSLGSDCRSGLECAAGKCSEEQVGGGQDTDRDGIPDQWELQQGLDPNDPSDAEEDSDNDELTNLEEYTYRTDPNNADTDGDGASDKKEIDKGTDPLDPLSRPKGILLIFFLMLILIAALAAGGYGAYRYHKSSVERRNIARRPLLMPRTIPGLPQRKPPQGTEELFRRKEEQKQNERGKLFAAFGTGPTQKAPEQKPPISKPAEVKHGISPPKQEKEDIITRLKLISRKAEEQKAIKKPAIHKRAAKMPKEAPKKKKNPLKSSRR